MKCKCIFLTADVYIYIYAFSRRFYPKLLTIAFRLYIFISMCVLWESNPQPFALLTQCSTTEPQEHSLNSGSALKGLRGWSYASLWKRRSTYDQRGLEHLSSVQPEITQIFQVVDLRLQRRQLQHSTNPSRIREQKVSITEIEHAFFFFWICVSGKNKFN